MRFFPRFLSAFMLVTAAGCSVRAAPPEMSAAAPAPNDTLARIQTLAANPTCMQDSQCHALALGATPCGGPERYLAWSSARTPAGEIEALGKVYEEERRRANAVSGRMGACRFTPDPGAVCRAGVCVLGEAAPMVR